MLDGQRRYHLRRTIVLSRVVFLVTASLGMGLASGLMVVASQTAPRVAATHHGICEPLAQDRSPTAVALAWQEALSHHDFTPAWPCFADDVVYVGGPPCGARTLCVGPDTIMRQVALAAAAQHWQETLISTEAAGNLVRLRAEFVSDLVRDGGFDRIIIEKSVTIVGDKIAAWTTFPDLSDPQTAAYVTGATSRSSATPSARTDPAAVVTDYLDAANRSDAQATLELFTPDVVVIDGPNCPPPAPCVTATGNEERVRHEIGLHEKRTLVGAPYIAANFVQFRLAIRNDLQHAAGISRFLVDVQALLLNERIGSWVAMPDLRDQETLTFTLFLQQEASFRRPTVMHPTHYAQVSR